MKSSTLVPQHTKVDASNRITLPEQFSDRIPWLKNGEVRAWLLLVAEGRYRLLSDQQLVDDPELEPVRQLILEGRTVNTAGPTSAIDSADAAIVARLTPVTVSPPGPGWRIAIPRSLDVFLPENCDGKKFSVLLSPDGYWEIWYTDVLKKNALSSQPED